MFITQYMGFSSEELYQLRILMDSKGLKSVDELAKELNGSYKLKLNQILFQIKTIADYSLSCENPDEEINEIINICNKGIDNVA